MNREAVTEGVTFYLKYLGSTLLDELPTGQSYGEGQSSKAVQRIVDMVGLVCLCLSFMSQFNNFSVMSGWSYNFLVIYQFSPVMCWCSQ